jgi:hypothetical protein
METTLDVSRGQAAASDRLGVMHRLFPILLIGCSSGLQPTDTADGDTDLAADVDEVPFLAFLEPDGINDASVTTYDILWNANDPDSEASITLSYGTETTVEGVIVEGLKEGTDTTYTWDVSGMVNGTWFVHATLTDAENEVEVVSTGAVTVEHIVLHPPTLAFIEPNGVDDTIGLDPFQITWEDDDPDDDATISLFWDDNPKDFDGTLLELAISEDDGTDSYSFDPTLFGNGDYYIYGIITDGDHTESIYALGPITVFYNDAPTITVTDPDGASDLGDADYTIRWTDDDPDNDATIALYYDDNDNGEDGTLIVDALSEDDTGDFYLWNTSLVAEGNYWIYAVIDDGYETQLDYSDGPVTVEHNPCVAASGIVTVPLSPVEIAVDLYLDGAVVDTSNTGAFDEGRLALRSTTTDDWAVLPSAYDDANGVIAYPAIIDLLPGFYDVYYQSANNGDNWPANKNALILSDVDLTTDTTLTVDVVTVDIEIDVTLNGQAVSSTNTWSTDKGTLTFRDPVHDDEFVLTDVWDDAVQSPLVPYTERIVPGTFDVFYTATDPSDNWPQGESLIESNADLGFAQSATWDVTAIDVWIEFTLDGGALQQSNSSADDYGRVWFVDAESQKVIDPGPLWDTVGNHANNPLEVKIVPTTLEVWYSNEARGANWPWNAVSVLDDEVPLATPQTVAVDIPVVSLTADLTLNGAAATDQNSSGTDEGGLTLRQGTDVIFGDGAWDDTNLVATYPADIPVIPGIYDARYRNVDKGANWPWNSNALLESDVDLSVSTSLSWDVATAEVELNVTLAGVAVDAANTNDEDEGDIYLVRQEDEIRFETWDDATDSVLVPITAPVIQDTYNVHYRVLNNGDIWPDNDDAVLTVSQDLRFDTSLTVDIPYEVLVLDLTFDGLQISSSNTSETDQGSLLLIDDNGMETELAAAWDSDLGVMRAPWGVELVPGTYEVYYTYEAAGGVWPANDRYYAMCMDVP